MVSEAGEHRSRSASRDAPDATVGLSRRRFLTATGLAAAAAAILQLPGAAGISRAVATPADRLLDPLLNHVAGPLLHELSRDTIGGVVAWVVPGEDAYSHAQAATDDLGGVMAGGEDFLLEALDEFLPLPDTYLQPLTRALLTGVSSVPLPAAGLDRVLGEVDEVAGRLDHALLELLDNGQAVPISAVIALLCNLAASTTHPDSVVGPFISPFANLSYEQKFDAWRMLEEDTATLVATFDGGVPQPLRASLSGLVRFAAGAVPEFAAFGSYTEAAVFDADGGVATQRPVGWDMSSYVPGRLKPADGWDELLGYYGGVREAAGTPSEQGGGHA